MWELFAGIAATVATILGIWAGVRAYQKAHDQECFQRGKLEEKVDTILDKVNNIETSQSKYAENQTEIIKLVNRAYDKVEEVEKRVCKIERKLDIE